MGKHSQLSNSRPLFVCGNEHLLDQVLALSHRAGVDLQVVADAGAARMLWPDASVVLVDGALAGTVELAGLPRRPNVIVLGADLDDAEIWRRALNIGADHVVFLPDAEQWLISTLGAAAIGSPSGRVIAVVGGSGGVGASTTAAALAIYASKSEDMVALVDADPRSGGMDLLLGAEDEPGVRWPELANASGFIDPDALLAALPVANDVSLLTWDDDVRDVSAVAMTSAVTALASRCDVVVVDLGRARSDCVESLLPLTSLVVLIVPARVRGVAAARRLLPILAPASERLHVAVRMPSPGGLDPADIQAALGLPSLGEVPHDARRAEHEENGLPPRVTGAWQRLAEVVLARCGTMGRAA